MALLDRYIQAVQQHLPVARREDAGRELRELLEEQISLKAENKGSSLSEKELSRLLQAHGHPYQVAHAIMGERGLISPEAFPLYKRTLIKGSALFFMLMTLWYTLDIALGKRVIGVDWVIALITHSTLALLVGFTLITGVFHYLGNWLTQREMLWSFNPQRLPAINAPWVEIKTSQSIAQIVLNMGLLFFLANNNNGFLSDPNQLGWQISDITYYLQIPMFFTVCLHVINLLQPVWTQIKLLCFAVISLSAAGLLMSSALVPNPFGQAGSYIWLLTPTMIGISALVFMSILIKRAFSGLVSRV